MGSCDFLSFFPSSFLSSFCACVCKSTILHRRLPFLPTCPSHPSLHRKPGVKKGATKKKNNLPDCNLL